MPAHSFDHFSPCFCRVSNSGAAHSVFSTPQGTPQRRLDHLLQFYLRIPHTACLARPHAGLSLAVAPPVGPQGHLSLAAPTPLIGETYAGTPLPSQRITAHPLRSASCASIGAVRARAHGFLLIFFFYFRRFFSKDVFTSTPPLLCAAVLRNCPIYTPTCIWGIRDACFSQRARPNFIRGAPVLHYPGPTSRKATYSSLGNLFFYPYSASNALQTQPLDPPIVFIFFFVFFTLHAPTPHMSHIQPALSFVSTLTPLKRAYRRLVSSLPLQPRACKAYFSFSFFLYHAPFWQAAPRRGIALFFRRNCAHLRRIR
jgi:hypothetical protein